MGISTISKLGKIVKRAEKSAVSIPNGDKHDFKTQPDDTNHHLAAVSIPNGDKHDFKTGDVEGEVLVDGSFNPQWG